MKSTIHKWVVKVIPVTNPTQYTKSDKLIVKQNIKARFSPEYIRVRFRESLPIKVSLNKAAVVFSVDKAAAQCLIIRLECTFEGHHLTTRGAWGSPDRLAKAPTDNTKP